MPQKAPKNWRLRQLCRHPRRRRYSRIDDGRKACKRRENRLVSCGFKYKLTKCIGSFNFVRTSKLLSAMKYATAQFVTEGNCPFIHFNMASNKSLCSHVIHQCGNMFCLTTRPCKVDKLLRRSQANEIKGREESQCHWHTQIATPESPWPVHSMWTFTGFRTNRMGIHLIIWKNKDTPDFLNGHAI